MKYNDDNVFARILRGDVPCKKVYENDFALAFHDHSPKAPVHVLVIPKGKYKSQTDFGENASAEEITGFYRAVSKVAHDLGINQQGYRILSNKGQNAGQEVQHFHVHLFGGKPLGPMLSC